MEVTVVEQSQTQKTLDLLRDEWTRPYREALEQIMGQDPVDNALDPQWAARIARETLAANETS